jgi:hypothetical protein
MQLFLRNCYSAAVKRTFSFILLSIKLNNFTYSFLVEVPLMKIVVSDCKEEADGIFNDY